ncbi:SDR family oxidoreductase [Rhodococcus opacus]|nr:SDR family oxidoreductase [Rhodococcus opacus]
MNTRVAIVTGAASGLGRATAVRLAEDGLTVVVAGRDVVASKRVAAELPGTGHLGVAIDIAEEDSVRKAFDVVERASGPVSVLACFAAISTATGARGRVPIVDTGAEEWDGISKVNTRGTFLCVREMMRRRFANPVDRGRIVIVGSMAGQVGGLMSGAAYSSSKAAVLGLTKVAAREALPLRMTVNAIAPGPIDSPALRASVGDGDGRGDYSAVWDLPLGRIGLDREVAAAASYLISEDGAYVTGATIDVNGGLNMR